ncbi:MAG: hypothetical protein ACR2L2_05010 [Acidobacteriota bacterium]
MPYAVCRMPATERQQSRGRKAAGRQNAEQAPGFRLGIGNPQSAIP